MKMLYTLMFAGSLTMLTAAAPAFAEANPTTCAACHGANGISTNPIWPNLAGQSEKYLFEQLKAFKAGERKDPVMSAQAASLSEEDMLALAKHYAGLPGQVGSADENLVEAGTAVYRGGNAKTGVTACIACHGPQGKGNAAAGFPAISGQHSAYLAAQLKAYRASERGNPKNVKHAMMQSVASKMTDAEIEAVSSYVAGLN